MRDQLRRIRELLALPTSWCQEDYAQLEDGRATHIADPAACRFCLMGAIERICGPNDLAAYHHIRNQLRIWTGRSLVAGFNDDPQTMHAHVVELLDQAIAA